MDEHSFVRSVHRHLPSAIYKWKINARFIKGVPDAWYSGPGGDLWVEYKFSQRTPKKRVSLNLSANQQHWLNSRHREGRMLAVVFGCPLGSIILDDATWDGNIAVPSTWLSPKKVAEWITAQTLCT